MKVLLVLPRVFPNIYEPTHFPVGMAYISSYLKSRGHLVEILNLNFLSGTVSEEIESFLASHDIEIVETGALVTHYHLVKEIVDCVKAINPRIYTVIGGGLVTGAPLVVMKGIKNADFAVFGEGEITNAELCDALSKGVVSLDSIPGIVYRSADRSEVIQNIPRSEIDNIDTLPFPDYEGFALKTMLEYAPKRYLTMSTGRSCAFNCTFCFHTSGQRYRQRSLDSFFTELDYVVEEYGIDNIYLTDELFAYDKKRLDEFCERIKRYNILWAVQLRVDIITKDLLQRLKDSGCIILSLGLESADDRVLKSMRKNITIAQIENALECCYQVGISAHGAFIFGDIAENDETVNNTLSWWSSHRKYNVSLQMIQVYPGTVLYQHAVQKGVIKDELQFIIDGCPFINISELTDDAYTRLANSITQYLSNEENTLNNIKITKKDKKKRMIDLTGECSFCGAMNTVEKKHAIKITSHKCESCGNSFTLTPMAVYRELMENRLAGIIKDHKIVLWKATALARDIMTHLDKSSSSTIMVVDDDRLARYMDISGRPVLPSDSISESYDTIIICDYTFETHYAYYVKSLYPAKNVMGIWDIIDSEVD